MLCKIGLHKWVVFPELDLHGHSPLYVFQPFIPEIRVCKRCDKSQWKHIDHCLGLNPPEYVIVWRNL